MQAIEVKGLTKYFGSKKERVKAVDDISFSVKKGEIFGLLGVNGAGKTTTINMLTGLLLPDSGNMIILGKDPQKDWEYVKNRMNVSTAYFPLSDVLTIRENLKVYAKIYGIKKVDKKIDDLLKKFELYELRNRKVIDLSSGERTRTALCKGLLNDPEVLFLDECTVGLDPDIAEKTRNIIKKYNKDTKCTIIFTSHYMYEVEELCDRIAFMENGKIITIATAVDLKRTIKSQTIELTLKKDAEKLKEIFDKSGIDVIFAEGQTLIFKVSTEKDALFDVMNKIFEKGFILSDLHIKKPTLDDVFINIARGKK